MPTPVRFRGFTFRWSAPILESVFALYVSLAFLGLAAVDPVGIGVMPVLLAQERPYRRALVFLSGSFAALMVMGLLFAKGFGRIVLHFEHRNHWFIPSAEIAAGTALLVVAVVVYIQLRGGKFAMEPSGKTREWLKLGSWHLFLLGAFLVAVQSILDVVFVVAMVRVGQFRLPDLVLAAAVAVYAIAALILQMAVVMAFWLAPARQKHSVLQKVRALLARYSYQVLLVVSLVLSALLFFLAI